MRDRLRLENSLRWICRWLWLSLFRVVEVSKEVNKVVALSNDSFKNYVP